MELASKYNPADVEGKWYQYWLDHKLFSSKPDGREPYTIVIPPPNVTGVLHMGHMLNNTIQDILVRRARMEGKNACWVPGTDHASIATEAKVVNKLAAQGIKKTDLTRDEFLKHAWEWTDEHGGIILKQLRKLGASCDWDRTAFTMDEKRSESVIKVFVDLYNKGLIYRGVRMVNWDPKALTALSDEEVIYKEEHSKLYYLKYYVADDDMSGETGAEGEVVHRDASGKRYAVVATTRPETIMGDTAMCINPADPKNQWLKGKKVIVPLVNRVIPVIQDDYVDVEFGTGCLKVTPAHDVNDYMLGEKYNLPAIDIFNDNGTLSEAAGLYVGMDRFDVREQIEKDLQGAGLLEKVEAYTNKVGFSERTNVAIEPKLSMQWFLKMQHFADMAGDTPDAFIERVQDLRPREAKALLLSKRDLFELIQNEGSPGRRPIVLSDTPDALTGHTRGYGKDNLRPGDYLESFARFVREQRDEIAALNIICTRPADLSRASLKSLRLALGREGFTLRQLNSALSQTSNKDIAADIISFIRRYGINAELLGHEERIRRAVARLKQAHNFSRAEEKWIDRMEKYLLNESVLSVHTFDESVIFREKGGFAALNKLFNNQLESIVTELNTYLYDDGGLAA